MVEKSYVCKIGFEVTWQIGAMWFKCTKCSTLLEIDHNTTSHGYGFALCISEDIKPHVLAYAYILYVYVCFNRYICMYVQAYL